ncbi:mitotic spindle assembly checkpoint protein MAD1 isoform X6 [Monodelphis domestica]|uniref:mitotic spindle assembly checkpoint protein MAD1 isoform X6 n=1 Tax=Monodelphis domestica TaxID=13616 RepID=UPI0024E2253A|nr:mitotic spindle assembly checkpoint protein MAD1 isoform X6 [Monodelphis domestica]
MENLEENTAVLSSLRTLEDFISKPDVEGGSSLNVQYQQSMQLEERAEQIRSKSHLIQVEREKIQMELSHKRARVELEKAATTNARNYEREADRNQELLTRIKQLHERQVEMENKLKEQTEINRSCKQNLDTANKKLQEKENKLAEANETISELKVKISELQWNIMNQEMQVKNLESQKQELMEQLDVQNKKCQETNQRVQELQANQCLIVDNEQKIKELEQKLSLQEQDAAIVKNMKSELVRFPKMEREVKQLREENAYLSSFEDFLFMFFDYFPIREMKENNGLLKEEVEGLQRKLERHEKLQEDMVALELEKEKLLEKLKSWERMDQSMGLNISARILEKMRQQLQEDLLKVQSQLVEERKKREYNEGLARRLQKRVFLLTKVAVQERDVMRSILNSFENDLSPAEHSPQLTLQVREAEDMVQNLHAHSAEMEVQLSQALEELGEQKGRADMLEMELKILKSQTGSVDQSLFVSNDELNALRLKVEELVTARNKLEEEKKNLEMQLEQLTLQGYYDQSKTKVIHLSKNPASLAKGRLKMEQQQLQEECQQLQELVRVLEGGGAIPNKLEGVGCLQPSQEISDLKKQLESAELKNQRLKEVFQTKIQEFRKVCYTLTGYRIDFTTENQYRLTSMYAEHKSDCLIFKASSPSRTKMQLLETEFSRTIRELIDLHLLQQDSIPVFLSSVTLDLFSRQTIT